MLYIQQNGGRRRVRGGDDDDGGEEGEPARPQRPLPPLPPPRLVDPRLRQDILNRIFSPVASMATDDWLVPDYTLAMPPMRADDEEVSRDYSFQELLQDQHRSWDWVTNNVTMFYESPIFAGGQNRRYYLRARSNPAGVSQTDWTLLFPNTPGALLRRMPYTFRTFELIDVTNENRFNARDHVNLTVYFDVDLASRSPEGIISIPLNEDDDLQNVTFQTLMEVDFQIDPMIGHPITRNSEPLAIFASIIYTIANHLASNRLYNNPSISIVLGFEVHRNGENESALISRGIQFVPDAQMDMQNNMYTLMLRIVHLLWRIRTDLMVERYEEDNAHVFHPRSVRILLNNLPGTGGQISLDPPRGLIMPRGGCLSYGSMPITLANMLEHLVVSHDIYRNELQFDNNCGIREALISMGRATLNSPNDINKLFKSAAKIRNETPSIPAFIRLSPQDVLNAVHEHIQDRLDFAVYELPSPEKPRGHLYQWPPETEVIDDLGDENTRESLFLVLGHGHYFGLRTNNLDMDDHEAVSSRIKEIMDIKYCKRCRQYAKIGQPRVSHDFEEPSLMYPECKPRLRKRKNDVDDDDRELIAVGDFHEPPGWREEDNDEETPCRILRKSRPTPAFMLTPLRRIGFMDLETWRPVENKGYHEVYAVGWIKEASWHVDVDDVKLYSSHNDPNTHNSALIFALADLIKFLTTNSKLYTRKRPYFLYLYNGSGFDNLFLLHIFSTIFHMTPEHMTLKDGQLLTMTYLSGSLVIRDLYLFTGCSLAKACKMFHIEDRLAKGSFDHNSINSLMVVNDKWKEISEYLSKDLTALNYVFLNFRKACYETTKLDLCTRITKSHLAYDYWISTLTEDQRLIITLPDSFDVYQDILKAYYGGRVFPQVKDWRSDEFYEPYLTLTKYLHLYDVVSLYPSAMWYSEEISNKFCKYEKRNIPLYFCGTPHFVTSGREFDELEFLLRHLDVPREEGKTTPPIDLWRHICSDRHENFLTQKGAIVCVDFEPNSRIMMPILPHKGSKGETAWDLLPHNKQWYVLEEILDAKFYGYRVTRLHCAYVYPTRNALFDTSMKTLMEGKTKCLRGDPKRDIYKIWANSTYGKHAQKAITEDTKVIQVDELESVLEKEFVISIEPIADERYAPTLQRIKHNREHFVYDNTSMAEDLQDLLSEDYDIPVSAFVVKTKPRSVLPSKPTYLGAQVTAYSRMHMNWFCYCLGVLYNTENVHFQVFYTDTDSLIIHVYASTHDVKIKDIFGTAVGMLDDELEGGRIVEFVSLAPKTYALTYRMPDGTMWMKVRCKGIPHTKDPVPYFEDHTIDPSPYMTNGEFDPSKIDLGQYIYCVVDNDGKSVYYKHLSTYIFRDLLYNRIRSLTVYFTSMRRCFFGLNAMGHIAGIKHSYMDRTLTGAPWWSNNSNRVEVEGSEPGLTFPVGHYKTFTS